MNRKEWLEAGGIKTPEYHRVKALCDQFKAHNHIEETCNIHHLMDTPEQIAYNNAYYERWGVDENGNFTEGQYVVFLTHSEHARWHMKYNNPMYNEEIRQKVSDSRKGFKHSDETRRRLSESHKGKSHGPLTEEIRKRISESNKITWSDPVKRKQLSDARKGRGNPMFGKVPGNARVVVQRDINGKILRKFVSLKEASTELGISVYCIIRTCNGLRNQSDAYTLTFE